jgi:hypothetical protein
VRRGDPRREGTALTAVDLLDELRAALDELDPLLAGRIVDIEMARLRVLEDASVLRPRLVALVAAAIGDDEPAQPLTIRVTRSGSTARIDVVAGEGERDAGRVIGSTTVPLVPGSAHAADG